MSISFSLLTFWFVAALAHLVTARLMVLRAASAATVPALADRHRTGGHRADSISGS